MSEPANDVEDVPARPRPRRLRRFLKRLAITVLILLIAAELVLRFVVGMGDPPLLMVDPDMEYRYQPSRTYHRFGRLVHYNAYSQRADDFPQHKSSPDELRVMVVGDSVVNGGVLTDQSRVVTTILQNKLSEALRKKVIVGNASAGSWGPPNELAYVKKFGLFDADVVVFVFNDLDAFDAMTFNAEVSPTRTPWLALTELITKYVPMFTARYRAPPPPAPSVDDEAALQSCKGAIVELVRLARARGARVIIAQHKELPQRLSPDFAPKLVRGHEVILQLSRELGIEPIQLNENFDAAMKAGQEPYRPNDFVHPSDLGNQLIADALFPVVKAALTAASTRPTTNILTTRTIQPN